MVEILNKEDKAAIDSALKVATALDKEINKAKLAGIDMSAQEADLKASRERLLSIKRVYFPS